MRTVLALTVFLFASSAVATEIQMRVARARHTATPLTNGDVFIVGGDYDPGSTEIFEWRSDRFEPGPESRVLRVGHATVQLPDGTVFIFGGLRQPYVEWCRPTGPLVWASDHMARSRADHTATVLHDRTVLIVGGTFYDVGGFSWPRVTRYYYRSAELYAPFGGPSQLIPQTAARADHTATLLADGTVLITGGVAAPDYNGSPPAAGLPSPQRLSSVELFIPSERRFVAIPDMMRARGGHTATLLPDGRILLAGGDYEGTAEVYDPARGSSTLLYLNGPRSGHTATLLDDERVILIGGSWDTRTEVFDAATGTFIFGPSIDRARIDHTTTKLPDGRLLIAGGSPPSDPFAKLGFAEIIVGEPPLRRRRGARP